MTSETRGNAIATFVFLGLIVVGLVVLVINRGGFLIEDDAYYYTIVAKNLAATGHSTFDDQTLTNGYHPLWLLVLTLMAATIGLSDAAIAVVEVVLATFGIWHFLAAFRSPALVPKIVFVTIFAFLATPLVARGMEISLLIFGLGLFARLACSYFEGRGSAVGVGLAAILCIGARIDSAVFVVPILILAAGNLRRLVVPMALIAAAGGVYAGINLWVFGLPFPVSGAIKSLGGLQVNHRYLQQALAPWQSGGTQGVVAMLRTTTGKLVALFLLAAIAAAVLGRRAKSWPICLGFVIGIVLFLGKLTFGSSWVIWSWYGFPMFLGLFAVFSALDDVLMRSNVSIGPVVPWSLGVLLAVAVAAGGFAIARSNGLGQPPQSDFAAINRLAAAQFGPVFAHGRVAMGDRAGSFAEFYDGPVTQIEGLVNDRAWLEAVKRHDDLRAVLCARGVTHVLAYQVDLGVYDEVSIPVLRTRLTQFEAPSLTFAKADEIGRVFDLGKFDNRATDEGDVYLYAWRLSGCPAR